MIRLGITGGIGSGKSTVCKIFEHLGVPVYYADVRARELVGSHAGLKQEIISAFGSRSFEGGVYNRAYIASLVFNDPEKRQLLNGIIHPYVLKDWDDFCHTHSAQPYVVKEAAIMLETDSKKSVDHIVLVYSPLPLRMKRIRERDGLSDEEIMSRIHAQMPEEEKLKRADGVIINDGTHSLIGQVLDLHRSVLSGSL